MIQGSNKSFDILAISKPYQSGNCGLFEQKLIFVKGLVDTGGVRSVLRIIAKF